MNKLTTEESIFGLSTFVKSIHIQLTNKRRNVGVFEILPADHEQGKE